MLVLIVGVPRSSDGDMLFQMRHQKKDFNRSSAFHSKIKKR